MADTNQNARLEAFCDAVFAIALTLLIIDIKIPPAEGISDTTTFLHALQHIIPSVLAFILSFIIIFITWVNHHNSLRLVDKSSVSFIYANGFMLLTVVFTPFPTSLVGEYILMDHAAPAVILYNSTLAVQALSWILLTRSVLKDQLSKNEKSKSHIRNSGKFGYFAFVFYSLCAILAIWLPLTIAVITTISWIFWLIYGIRIKHE